jgi:hypothetical protein
LSVTETNVVAAYGFAKINNFEIDPEFEELVRLVTECESQPYEIKLTPSSEGYTITNAERSLTNYINKNMAKKIIKLNESDLMNIVKRVIKEQDENYKINMAIQCFLNKKGIKDLNVQTDVPVIFCLLTDNNEQQSIDRSGGVHGNKGTEAAIAAIKMAELRRVSEKE